ncbi:MAG: hypothetical protein SOX83_01960, partial [Sodaliphilus sp.]|nr:hypothetical protein [Sodaliphilus sp.]
MDTEHAFFGYRYYSLPKIVAIAHHFVSIRQIPKDNFSSLGSCVDNVSSAKFNWLKIRKIAVIFVNLYCQKNNKNTAMFPNNKIIEIFSICDDFSKVFDKTLEQKAIPNCNSSKKRKYHRDGMMSDSEVMTILILFHDSGYRCLKHFYIQYVCKYMRHLFPKTV